jgi:hypothetical protein
LANDHYRLKRPCCPHIQKKNKIEELEAAIAELEKKNAALDAEVTNGLSTREPSVRKV